MSLIHSHKIRVGTLKQITSQCSCWNQMKTKKLQMHIRAKKTPNAYNQNNGKTQTIVNTIYISSSVKYGRVSRFCPQCYSRIYAIYTNGFAWRSICWIKTRENININIGDSCWNLGRKESKHYKADIDSLNLLIPIVLRPTGTTLILNEHQKHPHPQQLKQIKKTETTIWQTKICDKALVISIHYTTQNNSQAHSHFCHIWLW